MRQWGHQVQRPCGRSELRVFSEKQECCLEWNEKQSARERLGFLGLCRFSVSGCAVQAHTAGSSIFISPSPTKTTYIVSSFHIIFPNTQDNAFLSGKSRIHMNWMIMTELDDSHSYHLSQIRKQKSSQYRIYGH